MAYIPTYEREARQEGIEIGKKISTKEAKSEGIKEGKLVAAKGMLKNGVDINTVAKSVGFPVEEIEKLAETVH